ncbi:MAG: cupin domain-containing protein [Parvularculaceae bacterium]
MTIERSYAKVRRIVTGVNKLGKSCILSDQQTPNQTVTPFAPLVAQVPWQAGINAARGDEPAPAGMEVPTFSPGPGDSVFRIVDFPPDTTYDVSGLQKMLDAHGTRDKAGGRHFWFHKSPTLDYAIVLDGEIWAMLDEDEALMKTGDVLIQRATNHAWSNRSDKSCRMAFVLITLSAEQLRAIDPNY